MITTMAAKVLILLVLPGLIHAQMRIEVVASANPNERSVRISGSAYDVISDTERNTFEIHDGRLKDAIGSFFGRRPDDAYVRSPTPWDDLYRRFGWQQVTRVQTPVRWRIMGVDSQPTIVSRQDFSNQSTKRATFNAQINQQVSNTVTNSWQKGGEFTVGQEVQYGFDIKAVNIQGKTSFSYAHSWGSGGSTSEAVTVGSTTGVEIVLAPYQRVIANLYATRGTMRIEVDYEATLYGDTAINYGSPYKGHHFWALDINGVMGAGGLRTKIESREVIEIGYYTDSKVEIIDAVTGSLLKTVPLEIY